MSEQEQEREKRMSDDSEVEAHRNKHRGDEGSEDELGKRETGEESEVEAHRHKH
jgi:hypothetical protein